MNKKGFTLVELVATIVVLGIVVGITMYMLGGYFGRAKEKTEGVFVNTIEDALKIYLDSDARYLDFSDIAYCKLEKTHGTVNVYMADDQLTFDDVINSEYVPITKSELHNPANKNTDRYECKSDGKLTIYRDDDYVYYYHIEKDSFDCLNNIADDNSAITNLPTNCELVDFEHNSDKLDATLFR